MRHHHGQRARAERLHHLWMLRIEVAGSLYDGRIGLLGMLGQALHVLRRDLLRLFPESRILLPSANSLVVPAMLRPVSSAPPRP